MYSTVFPGIQAAALQAEQPVFPILLVHQQMNTQHAAESSGRAESGLQVWPQSFSLKTTGLLSEYENVCLYVLEANTSLQNKYQRGFLKIILNPFVPT